MRVLGAALAVALLAAATPTCAGDAFDPFWKLSNVSAALKAATSNGATVKEQLADGQKPISIVKDRLDAARGALKNEAAAVVALKLNETGALAPGTPLSVAKNATATVRAAKLKLVMDKFNETATGLAEKTAAIDAKLNGTAPKAVAGLDALTANAVKKIDMLAGDVTWYKELVDYAKRSLAADPDLAPFAFVDGQSASDSSVNQATNGQTAPAAVRGEDAMGERLVPGPRATAGGAAPSVESVADADDLILVGAATPNALLAEQRMRDAAAADAASEAQASVEGDNAETAFEPLDGDDLRLAAWLASKPEAEAEREAWEAERPVAAGPATWAADGASLDAQFVADADAAADAATPEDAAEAAAIVADVEAAVDGADSDETDTSAADDDAEAEAEGANDERAAPFDGSSTPQSFAIYDAAKTQPQAAKEVVGVPQRVRGPGVAIPDIDGASSEDQVKYIKLRAMGVKRDLALDAIGETEGRSFKVTLAYIVARLKWGDGVDLFFDGAAAKPQSVDGAVPGPTRRLLAAGRRLLQVTVATFIGDTTRTSATFNGFVNEPPDQALCVGGGFVIEATNVVISIRSTSTPATPLANWPKALSRFFGGVSGDSFGDPRCIYDPTSNVFIVAAYRTNGANSWIALASSPAGNPAAGIWKTWSIDSRGIGVLAKCTATAPCFGDYPMLGFNDNSVWVTTNAFSKVRTSFVYAGIQLFGFSKAAIVAQAPSLFVSTSGRTDIFTLQPMKRQTATGNVMHLLATYDATRQYILTVSNTDRLALGQAPSISTPRLLTTGLRIASPPTVRQANNVQVDGGDTRILSLAFANGRLYATCNTAAAWSGVTRNSVAYYVINASTRTAVYAGVYGSSAFHTYGAAIAASQTNANAAGFVAFTTGSRVQKFASLYARVTVGTGVTAAYSLNGAAPNNVYLTGFTSPIRTGDYSDACVDPATGIFWGATEQGQSASTTSNNNWGTVIWKAPV